MGCDLRDQLGIQYLETDDLMNRARQRLNQAVTQTNIECANTELRRIEAYKNDVLREFVDHCQDHGCATPELEGICGLELTSRSKVA